jgi:polysaccharide pyruvyl transferase WcaK-like protein
MKILFVGDLRSVSNYGAIATTETLNNLLLSTLPDVEIKYIDHRSFHNQTPIEGWGEKKRKDRLKRIRHIIPKPLKYIVKNVYLAIHRKVSDKTFIPYKLSLYEEYYQKMIKGEILQYEKNMIEWADIIYINGEGNIVNGTDKYGKYRTGGLYVLFIAWISRIKYQKKTCIVNHTVDPANGDILQIISALYSNLDMVYVRETLSLDKLKSIGIDNARFVPDALFYYHPQNNWKPSDKLLNQIDFSQPYICIGDSSGIRNSYNQVKWNVVEVLSELIVNLKEIIPQVIFVDGYNGSNSDIVSLIRKNKLGYVNLNNCSYHDLYYVLKNATIFISGRWHASILSVLAGTPILLWGSDSHKTRSLYTLLEYPYTFFEINSFPIHIDNMVNEVRKIISEKDEIKILLKNKLSYLIPRTIENVSFLSMIEN